MKNFSWKVKNNRRHEKTKWIGRYLFSIKKLAFCFFFLQQSSENIFDILYYILSVCCRNSESFRPKKSRESAQKKREKHLYIRNILYNITKKEIN